MITYRQLFSIINNQMTDEQMDQPIQTMDVDGNMYTVDGFVSTEVVNGYGDVRNYYYLEI